MKKFFLTGLFKGLSRRAKLVLLVVNIFAICSIVVFYRNTPQKFLTRLSFYTAKIKAGPRNQLENLMPIGSLGDSIKENGLMLYAKTPDGAGEKIIIGTETSVDNDRVFLDIYTDRPKIGAVLGKNIFFELLQDDLNLVQAKYNLNLLDGFASLSEFYYSNIFNPIPLNKDSKFISTRYNYVFVDRPTKKNQPYILFACIVVIISTICFLKVESYLNSK